MIAKWHLFEVQMGDEALAAFSMSNDQKQKLCHIYWLHVKLALGNI